MVRGGSTWSFHVALKLLRLSNPSRRVFGLYNENPAVLAAAARPRSSQLVIKSHVLDPAAYDLCRSGAVRSIYTWRQPYDAVVSCLQIFGHSVEHWIEVLRASLRVWSFHLATNDACIVSYESIMTKPLAEIARVAAYLCLTISDGDLRQSAEEVSFERVKQLGREVGQLDESRLVRAGNLVYDRFTQLHANHIRNGAMGFGTKILSESELSAIDVMLREEGFAFLAEPHGPDWLFDQAGNEHQAQLKCLQSIAADRMAVIAEKDAEIAHLREQLLRRAEVIERQESRLREVESAAAERLADMAGKDHALSCVHGELVARDAALDEARGQLERAVATIHEQEQRAGVLQAAADERLALIDKIAAEAAARQSIIGDLQAALGERESRICELERARDVQMPGEPATSESD